MQVDRSNESVKESKTTGGSAFSGVQELTLLPFTIQVYNIFPIEITAKRFPIEVEDLALSPNIDLNLQEPIINTEALRAQTVLDVGVSFPHEPRPFDITFRLAGLFTYEPKDDTEMVRHFLKQGSLSVLLPTARQLLLLIRIEKR